jgi:hypothetical protein
VIAAALLLGVAYVGLILTGILPSMGESAAGDLHPVPPGVRVAGWALILLAVIRWRVILDGVRRSGGVLLFALIVAILAAVVSGDGWLWNQFF